MLKSIYYALALSVGASAAVAPSTINAEDAAGPEAEETQKFYTVFRYDVPNKEDLKTPEVISAHRAHVEKYSKSVTSARILDDDGNPIGVMSIKAFNSLEEVQFYVYEDPYTKASLYTKIEIVPIDLYVLNAEYARVSQWFRDRNPGIAHNYTPPKPPQPCGCDGEE